MSDSLVCIVALSPPDPRLLPGPRTSPLVALLVPPTLALALLE